MCVVGSSAAVGERLTHCADASDSLCAAVKHLRSRFGWERWHGHPCMALTVATTGVRLAVDDDAVMRLNKEGRDGFPVKAPWIKAVLGALQACEGDTLVMQHLYTDERRVMHVAVRCEEGDRPRNAAPDWSPSATANYTAGCNSDFRPGDFDEVAQPIKREADAEEMPAKRARTASVEPRPPLECGFCGKTYTYMASYDK